LQSLGNKVVVGRLVSAVAPFLPLQKQENYEGLGAASSAKFRKKKSQKKCDEPVLHSHSQKIRGSKGVLRVGSSTVGPERKPLGGGGQKRGSG